MSTNADDVLLGTTGAPVVKFPVDSPGTLVKGTVISKEVRQARDLDGTPKTFDDGQPKLDVVITIQTELRDSSIDDDDGTRRIIAGYEMQKAIGTAMRNANVKTLDRGGMLAVKHTHNEAATKNGRSPTKKFAAEYKAPEPGDAANSLLGDAAGPSEPEPQSTVSDGQAEPAGSLL